jgi:hypothetical protein
MFRLAAQVGPSRSSPRLLILTQKLKVRFSAASRNMIFAPAYHSCRESDGVGRSAAG